MFDIDYLITPYIQKLLDDNESIVAQTNILLRLLNFRKYYKANAADISANWENKTNTRYDPETYYTVSADSEFIKEYAANTDSLAKVKSLINDLCSDLANNMGNYESIKDNAYKKDSVIQDLSGADFSFMPIFDETAKNEDKKPKNSLARVLGLKNKIQK